MISYNNPVLRGRFGNQLFQYAFLRTTAQRLDTKFYCPKWLGDKIFLLDDKDERENEVGNLQITYKERRKGKRFDKKSLNIEDGTKIDGWFQSEDYFDQDKVRKWYTFNEDIISSVREKYKDIDFSESVGIHLRFGDKVNNLKFVIPQLQFYRKALSYIKYNKHILVFSDEILKAKELLGNMGQNYIYISNNKDYEDFYLMTHCHDFISSTSTFSWWAAYLNNYPDKMIVAPREWVRPGHLLYKDGLCCKEWTLLKTCRFLLDDYRLLMGIKKSKDIASNIKVRIFDKYLSIL